MSVRYVDQFDLHNHRHDFTELVVVLDGAGDHVFDGRVVPICAGNVFVVDEAHFHGYRNASGLRIANILFDEPRLLDRAPSLVRNGAYQAFVHLDPRLPHACERGLRLTPEQFAEVEALVRQLHEELAVRGSGYEAVGVSLLVQLIVRLCRVYESTDSVHQRELNDIGRVVSFLENNYTDDITLGDLEGLVAMSVRTLHRRFRRLLRMTPRQYLTKVRVSHGARMLAGGTRPVGEIASFVGMPDSNYFSRRFRNVFGMSPSQYRRRAAADIQPR